MATKTKSTKKPAAKRSTKAKGKAVKAAKKPAAKAPKGKPAAKGAPREGTKTAQLVAMLSTKNGATVAELTDALGWQPHTMRAALTRLPGGVKPERSRSADGVTSYRIEA